MYPNANTRFSTTKDTDGTWTIWDDLTYISTGLEEQDAKKKVDLLNEIDPDEEAIDEGEFSFDDYW